MRIQWAPKYDDNKINFEENDMTVNTTESSTVDHEQGVRVHHHPSGAVMVVVPVDAPWEAAEEVLEGLLIDHEVVADWSAPEASPEDEDVLVQTLLLCRSGE